MQVKANCPFCTNKPLIIFSSFLGFACFSCRCDHVTRSYSIKVSAVRVLISLLSAAVIFLKEVYNHRNLNYEEDLIVSLKLTADAIMSISCTILIVNNICTTRTRIQFYKGIMATLNMAKNVDVDDLLKVNVVRKLRLRGIYVIVLSIVTAFMYSVAFNRYADMLMIYVYIMMEFCYTSEMEMHKEMFLTCHNRLKKSLTNKYKQCLYGHSLLQIIKNLQRLHICIAHNFNYCNQFSGKTIVMGLLVAIITTVIFVYVLLIEFIFGHGQLTIWECVNITVLLMLLFLPGTYVVFVVEGVRRSGDDVLSFLFRYPVSKLSPAEAAQVELLIATLTIQKPILRPCNLFTVGTRLLASLSGTVVTYLLVALQFHVSWTKNSTQQTTK